MITQNKNLNLVPGGIPQIINVSQYDKGQTLTFNLYNQGSPFTVPTGATVLIQGTKPDGHGFQVAADSFSESVVTCTLTEQMAIVAGDVITELSISKEGAVLATANFILRVEEGALRDSAVLSDSELPLILAVATQQMENAEAWATGTKNGEPVPLTDPQYHNNAKYWAEQASGSSADALKSEGYAVGKQNGTDVGSSSPYYHNNSKYYSEQSASSASTANTKAGQASTSASNAATSATNAANSASAASGSASTASTKATNASNSALVSEGFATGTQNGTPVGSGSPYYHNNAKYYSQVAPPTAAAHVSYDNTESGLSANNVQDAVDDLKQTLTDEVSARAQLGAHNHAYPFLSSFSSGNVSWALNDDLSITINGTNTSGSTFINYNNYKLSLKKGSYKLLGCVSPLEYIVITDGSNNTIASDTGSGASFTLSEDVDNYKIVIKLPRNAQATNLRVAPLIAIINDNYSGYTPFAETNQQLTQNKVDWKSQEVLGAKNLLPMTLAKLKAINANGTWSGNVYTFRGVTFTVNTDSNGNVTGITANGTASGGNGNFNLLLSNLITENAFILTGCPSNGDLSTYFIRIGDITEGSISYYSEVGVGLSIDSGRTINSILCSINNGVTVSNLVFKPMLRLASDTDSTFAPFAMTNQQLTEKVSEEDGTFTASQGILNTGRTYLHRFGKMVVCSFHINAVTLSISSTFVQIATLSIKPKMDTVVPIQVGSNAIPFMGLLDTNGNLYCIPREVVNSDRLIGNFSYYVN